MKIELNINGKLLRLIKAAAAMQDESLKQYIITSAVEMSYLLLNDVAESESSNKRGSSNARNRIKERGSAT